MKQYFPGNIENFLQTVRAAPRAFKRRAAANKAAAGFGSRKLSPSQVVTSISKSLPSPSASSISTVRPFTSSALPSTRKKPVHPVAGQVERRSAFIRPLREARIRSAPVKKPITESGVRLTGPAMFMVKQTTGRPYLAANCRCSATRASRALSICCNVTSIAL